ncbi:MAG TPA: DNA gyrase C-terminal beta-propeller domain-containing protein, partial [Planctomycetaceae bacterium]|nr:DNA gyrase C-terminal beta-propeller domain-containing protein [Planctomycetaceae bacterium]
VKGIARIVDFTDRKTPEWQVRLHIVLKRDADKEVVLNQLFQYSTLQVTFSVILLALVANRPQTLSVKGLLEEFLRHRVTVIRRRTEFLLSEARKRKHTVEGLLIAQSQIDLVIATIRGAASRAAAKEALQAIEVPAELIARALGEIGFKDFQVEKGIAEVYSLSANQSEAIVSMQLGSLANLERESLSGEHAKLLESIIEYLRLLSDEAHIRGLVRQEMIDLKEKYGNKRRTAISEEESVSMNRDDLVAEEPMVVTLSQRGYVKRTPLNTYEAQNRGGKGITGVKSDEEDDVKHLFVASTHAYLLFFTDRGRVHWQKVYDLPLQSRTSRGRAIVNLLQLQDPEERITSCLAVREFTDDRFLIMATRIGTVKKTALSAFSRPMKGGIIAIKLDEGDELIDVLSVSGDDDVVLATRNGMSIRFSHHDARPMGRPAHGVRGISLSEGDAVAGMVVADPVMTLLTVCEKGYGKRTAFGSAVADESEEAALEGEVPPEADADAAPTTEADVPAGESDLPDDEEAAAGYSGNQRYRRQRRGGKGLRDIRTTDRNGKVVDIVSVADDDEVIMITARGKIQRVRASDISQIGRNTQGVRIIRLDDGDALVSLARIPAQISE